MKEFRKKEDGLFICEECDKIFAYKKGLSRHINNNHIGTYKYFNKWIKDYKDNVCKICNKETIYLNFEHGYKNCCSKECFKKYNAIQIQNSNMKKYGVKSSFEREDVKEKCKETILNKYGVKNSYQSEKIKDKIKQIKKEKYGDENYNNREKSKQTCLKKFGVENIFQLSREKANQKCFENYGVKYGLQSTEIREKGKETMIEKYGVEYAMQNLISYEKQQKTAQTIKQFKNTKICYQALYELDFLNVFYDIFLDIERGPSIKYTYQGRNKIYFPDFYIPSLNLIIEIKSSYYAKRDKLQIEAKEKATISNGFKYIMIIDKNYSYFATV